jgi:hypothetical protein
MQSQLDYKLQNAVGVSDGTRWGYVAGGRINNDPVVENLVNSITELKFETETFALTPTILSSPKEFCFSVGSSEEFAFFMGGKS